MLRRQPGRGCRSLAERRSGAGRSILGIQGNACNHFSANAADPCCLWGAHLFNAGTCSKLGELAREIGVGERYPRRAGPDGSSCGTAPRKLQSEPVEDFRIDFEDGFGVRPDDEEDTAALRSAGSSRSAALPRQCGIRVKNGDRGYGPCGSFWTIAERCRGTLWSRYLRFRGHRKW